MKVLSGMFKTAAVVTVGVMLFTGIGAVVSVGAQPAVELPILLTSAGQSPDVLMIRVLLSRIGIDVTTDELAEADAVAGHRTLIFALGGSQKGLGAAGIDPAVELVRIESILEVAERENLTLIGVHIGGEGRRGPLSERFIEPTAPRMHYLIVTEEGNRDGYFNRLSEERGIGLTVVTNTLDVGPVIEQLLGR